MYINLNSIHISEKVYSFNCLNLFEWYNKHIYPTFDLSLVIDYKELIINQLQIELGLNVEYMDFNIYLQNYLPTEKIKGFKNAVYKEVLTIVDTIFFSLKGKLISDIYLIENTILIKTISYEYGGIDGSSSQF